MMMIVRVIGMIVMILQFLIYNHQVISVQPQTLGGTKVFINQLFIFLFALLLTIATIIMISDGSPESAKSLSNSNPGLFPSGNPDDPEPIIIMIIMIHDVLNGHDDKSNDDRIMMYF